MKKLENNWFLEGLLDFEYKKYILLAYLQEVEKYFGKKELYPPLADLVAQYQNLISFKHKKDKMYESFPEQVEGADWQKFKLNYQKLIEDDKLMMEISEILHYSIPMMKLHLEKGRELYEYVEEKISIIPIGLVPLRTDQGYMLILNNAKKDTWVYSYSIGFFETEQEQYRGISTNFIKAYSYGFVNTFENIKGELIRDIPSLPNPAVYAVENNLNFPIDQTILQVAKRSLVKYLAN